MASMSSADPVAYVIERYLETYPDPKPINPLDFRAAVNIVTELVQKESGQLVRRSESRSSSILASVFTTARQYVFPENTTSEEGLEQVVALQNGASMYGRSTCDLLRIGFPFATISPELARTCLINKSSLSTVINQKLEEKYIEGDLRPGTTGWTEIETLVDGVSGDLIGKMLVGYYNVNRQQNPLKEILFHILLKMTICQEYTLPEFLSSKARDLGCCFEDSLKGVEYSTHRNPLKLIEIVLVAFPYTALTNDGFRAFVLKMLGNIPFVDWPNKERVLIAYLELRKDHLSEEAPFLVADDRTVIIGHHILEILRLPQRESNHSLSQLMYHLPLIPDGWFESVFRLSYPKFNVCQDFHFTPSCVRRVNLHFYSPVLVIGDLVIGLYEGRNKAENPETFWTCVAYHIMTEEVFWRQPLHLHDVQGWMIVNTPIGVAIPKQNSNEIEFYDVATGMKNGDIKLPCVYHLQDKLYITPAGYIYYYCKSEQKLFGTHFSSFSSEQVMSWKTMNCSDEVAGFSGHFIICKNTDTFELITPNHIKHSFLKCQHLSLLGKNLVRFERTADDEMEVIIQEIQEGSEFVLSPAAPKRYIIPFGYVQHVSMGKDVLIFSTLEGLYFVNLQNNTVLEIKRQLSPYYTPFLIDAETGTVWVWDSTKRGLYKGSPEGFVYIDQLTSSDRVRLLFARDEMLYMIG